MPGTIRGHSICMPTVGKQKQRSVTSLEQGVQQVIENSAPMLGRFLRRCNTLLWRRRVPIQCNCPTGLGLHRLPTLWNLKPFHTLWQVLDSYFPDPRLQQLFGRYATYVGSSPFQAPATLMLIAHVEQEGVWYIDGGMHALALAMRDRATSLGVDFRPDSEVSGIIVESGSAVGVALTSGEEVRGERHRLLR